MTPPSRRDFCKLAAAPALGFHILRAAAKTTDVRIVEIRTGYVVNEYYDDYGHWRAYDGNRWRDRDDRDDD